MGGSSGAAALGRPCTLTKHTLLLLILLWRGARVRDNSGRAHSLFIGLHLAILSHSGVSFRAVHFVLAYHR